MTSQALQDAQFKRNADACRVEPPRWAEGYPRKPLGNPPSRIPRVFLAYSTRIARPIQNRVFLGQMFKHTRVPQPCPARAMFAPRVTTGPTPVTSALLPSQSVAAVCLSLNKRALKKMMHAAAALHQCTCTALLASPCTHSVMLAGQRGGKQSWVVLGQGCNFFPLGGERAPSLLHSTCRALMRAPFASLGALMRPRS